MAVRYDAAPPAPRAGFRFGGWLGMDRSMGRVLYVTSTRIGDAVLASGVLAHLVEALPSARFTIAAGPLAAPLFRAAPRRDETIVMTKQRSGGHWLELWRRTVGRRWDMVVDLRGSRTSWFLRAGRRVIAARPRVDRHKVVEAGEVLRLSSPPAPQLWFDAAARDAAERALPPGPPILALAPAASAPFKEWPPERFAALAERLVGQSGPLQGGRVVIFGGPGDAATGAAVARGVAGGEVIDLTGKLGLLEAAACIAKARLFVGNDSGLMHLAAAARAPTLGLFGPTDERVYGPWGGRARALRAGGQVDAAERERLRFAPESLMGELTLAAVADAAHTLLADTETAGG
ncbi:MAG: glycosyltransferase family 9 protein [Caulobacterales bacterium]|nr:glycosyltransferase family 9 protein [Caulobacterales bacterium]